MSPGAERGSPPAQCSPCSRWRRTIAKVGGRNVASVHVVPAIPPAATALTSSTATWHAFRHALERQRQGRPRGRPREGLTHLCDERCTRPSRRGAGVPSCMRASSYELSVIGPRSEGAGPRNRLRRSVLARVTLLRQRAVEPGAPLPAALAHHARERVGAAIRAAARGLPREVRRIGRRHSPERPQSQRQRPGKPSGTPEPSAPCPPRRARRAPRAGTRPSPPRAREFPQQWTGARGGGLRSSTRRQGQSRLEMPGLGADAHPSGTGTAAHLPRPPLASRPAGSATRLCFTKGSIAGNILRSQSRSAHASMGWPRACT